MGKRDMKNKTPPSGAKSQSLVLRLNTRLFFRQLGIFLCMDLLLVVLAVLGGIGALVYFKFIKQKPKTKGSDNLDDYDYGEDEELPEDETWETEPEDADGGGDEESETPAK